MSATLSSAVAPSNPAPSTSTAPAVIRTGTLAVGERTTFGGRAWRSRGVVLNATSLTIHNPSRQTTLPLSSISALERTDLMPHSLAITFGTKTYHLSFQSDSELYDWQDDIYSRCPLGAQTSNPFDFQHTAHIGSSGARGTFAEPGTLPMFEEAMGRSIGAPAPAAAATPTPKSPQTNTRRRSNPLKGTIILNNNNNINIEGPLFVKPSGLLLGWYWKERWVSLKGNSLTVHTRKTKASPPAKDIALSTITSVEPDPKRSNCLFLATTQRDACMHILFPSDGEMYAWREAIYLRSGLSSVIGSPTNVVHAIHVSYDKESGELKGLPDQWKNDPSLTTPLVAKISMPTGSGNNNSNRSSRRRSRNQRASGTEAHQVSSAGSIPSASSTSPRTTVIKATSKSQRTSQTSTGSSTSSSGSSPLFSNLSRVPAPSIEASSSADSNGPSGGAPSSATSSQGLSSSIDSQGTLLGTPPSNPQKATLSMVHELETADTITPRP